jgi:hypothetical protein
VNRGQEAADQHYQQIDFHVTLRCHCSFHVSNAKGNPAKGIPAFPMTLA